MQSYLHISLPITVYTDASDMPSSLIGARTEHPQPFAGDITDSNTGSRCVRSSRILMMQRQELVSFAACLVALVTVAYGEDHTHIDNDSKTWTIVATTSYPGGTSKFINRQIPPGGSGLLIGLIGLLIAGVLLKPVRLLVYKRLDTRCHARAFVLPQLVVGRTDERGCAQMLMNITRWITST